MRRYRDQGDLRKLTEVRDDLSRGRESNQLFDDRQSDSEVNQYAMIEAAASIAAAQVGQRMNRLFVVAIAALGLLGGGLVVLANQAIDLRVERMFAEQSNAVFGFVTVQRNILELDRRFEAELVRVGTVQDPQAGQSAMRLTIDQTSEEVIDYLARFRELASGQDVTIDGLAGYTPSDTDLYALQFNLAELMDKVSYHARGITYYQPIIDIGLANPDIARKTRRFRRDFAYASGLSLLSEPALSRDLSRLQDLYDQHLRMLRELRDWPEYSLLFGLLIEDQLGASNEDLRGLASRLQDLSPADFGSLIDTIAEIGIDGAADDQYRLAADRTLATLTEGCDVGNFIPGPVCSEIMSSGVLSVFPSASSNEPLTSVGLGPVTRTAMEVDAWAVGIGGFVSSSEPVAKSVSRKEGALYPAWRD